MTFLILCLSQGVILIILKASRRDSVDALLVSNDVFCLQIQCFALKAFLFSFLQQLFEECYICVKV